MGKKPKKNKEVRDVATRVVYRRGLEKSISITVMISEQTLRGAQAQEEQHLNRLVKLINEEITHYEVPEEEITTDDIVMVDRL